MTPATQDPASSVAWLRLYRAAASLADCLCVLLRFIYFLLFVFVFSPLVLFRSISFLFAPNFCSTYCCFIFPGSSLAWNTRLWVTVTFHGWCAFIVVCRVGRGSSHTGITVYCSLISFLFGATICFFSLWVFAVSTCMGWGRDYCMIDDATINVRIELL